MKLDRQWRTILRRAWSIRLMALAVLLSVAEVVLPIFQDYVPLGWFALLTALVVAAAMVARIMAQQGL